MSNGQQKIIVINADTSTVQGGQQIRTPADKGEGGQNWAKICGRPVWMTPFTHTVKCKAINFLFWDF